MIMIIIINDHHYHQHDQIHLHIHQCDYNQDWFKLQRAARGVQVWKTAGHDFHQGIIIVNKMRNGVDNFILVFG